MDTKAISAEIIRAAERMQRSYRLLPTASSWGEEINLRADIDAAWNYMMMLGRAARGQENDLSTIRAIVERNFRIGNYSYALEWLKNFDRERWGEWEHAFVLAEIMWSDPAQAYEPSYILDTWLYHTDY